MKPTPEEQAEAIQALPLYQCYKQVRALKIKRVTPHIERGGNIPFCTMSIETDVPELKQVEVSGDFYTEKKPAAGGYLVIYEDGYRSYSPAEAFENGYSLLYDEPKAGQQYQTAMDGAKPGDPTAFLFDPNPFVGNLEIALALEDRDYETIVDVVAKECHEANRRYCESIGDDSQPTWDEAPDWQKESARNGVKFHVQTPDASASASHENWLAEKEADGWKYGPVKDPAKKEHPCYVPYGELPQEQKNKDTLFITVVDQYRDDLNAATV